MHTPLTPCPGCSRHVKVSDRACPFCASALPEGPGADPWPSDGPRLSRSATLLLGAALMATGCPSPSANIYGGPPTPPPAADAPSHRSGPPNDAGGGAEIYGAPPRPAPAPGVALPQPAPNDPQGVAAIYGGPPPPTPSPPPSPAPTNPAPTNRRP